MTVPYLHSIFAKQSLLFLLSHVPVSIPLSQSENLSKKQDIRRDNAMQDNVFICRAWGEGPLVWRRISQRQFDLGFKAEEKGKEKLFTVIKLPHTRRNGFLYRRVTPRYVQSYTG